MRALGHTAMATRTPVHGCAFVVGVLLAALACVSVLGANARPTPAPSQHNRNLVGDLVGNPLASMCPPGDGESWHRRAAHV